MSTSNPFPALEAALIGEVYLSHTPSYHPQLWLLAVIYAVLFCLTLATVVVRVRRDGFWLYRLHPTTYGSWIKPNVINCWLVYSGVFQLLAQVYIEYGHTYGTIGGDIQFAILFRLIIWLPLWIGGLHMTFSTAIAPAIQASAAGESGSRRPMLYSIGFVALNIMGTTVITTLSVIANRKYQLALRVGTVLQEVLAKASAAFDSGDLETVATLNISITRLFGEVAIASDHFIYWWRLVWIVYACINGSLAVVFTISAIMHYSSLKASFAKLEEAQATTGTSHDRERRGLKWGFRALHLTTAITLAICVSYLALGLFVAVRAREVAHGTRLTEIFLLLALYLYAFFGAIVGVAIFARSFLSPAVLGGASQKPEKKPCSSVTGASDTLDRFSFETEMESGEKSRTGEQAPPPEQVIQEMGWAR